MAEPVTLEQAIAQLRLDDGDDGEYDLIGSYITAARSFVESYTGLSLVPATVVEVFDGFGRAGRTFELGAWPISSITSVAYLDGLGASQILDPTKYVQNLAGRPVVISMAYSAAQPVVGAVSDAVTITVVAGYATPADVPAALKQAILLLVGHWFSNRCAVEAGLRAAAVELPFAVDALCQRWRRVL